MEGATPNEIAGFCVGALLVGATLAAPRVDLFIAQGQRRTLGLCEDCGGLCRVYCSQCKGRGRVQDGGWAAMTSVVLSRLWPSDDDDVSTNATPTFTVCGNCGGKGHFPCNSCCSSSKRNLS